MVTMQVPVSNILGMVFSFLVAWGMPIALCVVIRRRFKAEFSSFLLGCGGFFLFAMLLEQLFHMLVLFRLGPISQAIQDNLWLYAFYGGLAAGVFEETGRFLVMRYLMKGRLTRENALMYGAGHGGLEAVLILGVASVNNLVSSFILNSGTFASALPEGTDVEQVMESLAPLAQLPAWQFVLGGVERILAMGLQIALSLLVYQAVKNREKRYLFPLAIVLHMLVDMVVVLIANHGSLILAEGCTLIGTAAIGLFAWKVAWKQE